MLHLQAVTKTYAHRVVLRIPDLTVPRGIHWIKGVNGSGKTTLLRMIAGLVPFQGDIRLNGISLRQRPRDYRTAVSWAPAEPAYPGFVSGRQLFALYRHIRRQDDSGARALIERLGVADYLPDRTESYSSGMLKRLSLLLAFTGSPALILLDEPLATLDAGIAGLLPDLMRDYREKKGTNFLFSSHQAFPGDPFAAGRTFLVEDQSLSLQP